MAVRIARGVGAGGANQKDDVIKVQTLLCKVRAMDRLPPVKIDGMIASDPSRSESVKAIKDFQKKQFGWPTPDGMVDPGGRTLDHMNQLAEGPWTFLLEPVKSYRRGRWEVRIGADGQIRVRPGDWLSKYSAAVNDNFYDIWQYRRPDGNGQLIEIWDPNRIRTGESLYHVPTVIEFFKKNGQQGPPVPPPRWLSPEEKKKLTKEFLKGEYGLKGDRWKAFREAVDALGYVDGALGFADAAALIAEGSVLAGVATGTALASNILAMFASIISLLNALETTEQMTGMRAIAYATVAWAYGDPPPPMSPKLDRKIWEQFRGVTPELRRCRRTWADTVAKTEAELIKAATGYMGYAKSRQTQDLLVQAGKQRYQMIGNRQQLCLFLLKAFESTFSGQVLDTWKTHYDYLYKD